MLRMNRADSLKQVQERILKACIRCGRNMDEIELVAVSKTFAPRDIREVYDLGLRTFGESRAQEFRDKNPLLPGDIQWHFIGHLQTNKIKYVVPHAELIHSIDSVHLGQALSEFAGNNDVEVSVLIEINTSSEESKFGMTREAAIDHYLELLALPRIRVNGLMTMAPFTENTAAIRASFSRLRELRDELRRQSPGSLLNILSMGMSDDFEIAIEEGSTMVRIGSALFGARGR